MRKILVCSLVFTAACTAAWMSLALAREPNFVAPDQVNAIMILPAPPADESEATKAELAELHAIEGRRTQADIDHAKADEAEEDIFIFKTIFGNTGDKFTATALPLTAALSARVRNDESVNSYAAKEAFHRQRPYNQDKTLHPVCKTGPKDNSYPSGHATVGYLEGLVLASMVPEKRDAILARADDYAHNRLVCGVHHASDVEASKRIAYAIFAIMANNPQFQIERAAARAEVRNALELPSSAN